MRRVKSILRKNILVIVLLTYILLLSRIKFTAWPEMILWPYLMIKGWLPYADIAIAHNPILLYKLSFFFQIFGTGLLQLKVFTWIVIIFTALSAYWVAKKIFTQKVAILALLFLIPLQIYYQVNGLWFDLFLSFFTPLIFYFVYKRNFFWTGIFWALAYMTKQTAVFLLLPIFLTVTKSKELIQVIEKFIAGVFVVIIPAFLFFWFMGILDDYTFWTIKFAGGFLPFSEGQIRIPGIKEFLYGILPLALGLVIISLNKAKVDISLWFWAIASSMGVYPRWEYFHFLPATPFLAILFAKYFSNNLKIRKKVIIAQVIFLVFFLFIAKTVINDFGKDARFFEPEVYEVRDYLDNNTDDGDKIFVLNAWDHFYALTDTFPATKPWVPQFSWYFSLPGIEDGMLSDLITESPEFIVLHPYTSEGLDSFKPEKISGYVDKYYVQDGDFGKFIILKKR